MPEIGERIGGRYEVLGEAGSGRTSVIYRGQDTKDQKSVAIKAIRREYLTANPDGTMRFMREGAVLKQVNHPNIVQVYETFEEANGSYIIMEYLGGGNLERRIIKAGQLPIPTALSIGEKMADALAYLHSNRIYHRDITPLNIMFTTDDQPRLMDLSLAHMGHMSPMTLKNALLGSVAYMSPELLTGNSKANARTEIWSLGMTVYKSLAGVLPFNPKTARDVMTMTTTAVAPLSDYRSDISPDVVNLVGRMLAIKPEQRPQSMEVIRDELRGIVMKF